MDHPEALAEAGMVHRPTVIRHSLLAFLASLRLTRTLNSPSGIMETSPYNGTIFYQGRSFRIQRLGFVDGQPVAKVDPQDDDLEFALRLQLKAHGEVPLVTDPEPALKVFDSLIPFHPS